MGKFLQSWIVNDWNGVGAGSLGAVNGRRRNEEEDRAEPNLFN